MSGNVHHRLQLSKVVSAVRDCRGGIFGTSRDEGTKTLEGNLLEDLRETGKGFVRRF